MTAFSAVHRWLRLLLGVGVAAGAALVVAGCGPATPTGRAAKVVEVIVTSPITDTVQDYQDFTGRLDAIKTVDVRPHVTGYIFEAPFKEGDAVRKDDLLFQIDPRPFAADLAQAEANLKLAIADHKLQERNVRRASKMVQSNSIGMEEYDQAVANFEKAAANIHALEAARDRAKLYLDYTRVTAPLDGRISRRNVDPGNLVNADQTVLTTIVAEGLAEGPDRGQTAVYAYFDVDERTYLELVKAATAEARSWFAALQFEVLLRLAGEEDFTHKGTVNFLDNRLNANTGTIRMRAVVPNPTGYLKAGLFTRVRLPIGHPHEALLISDEALQSDQGKKYVWVVNADNKVEYRSVYPGQAIAGLRVIEDRYKLTDKSIESLHAADVPEGVLAKLAALKTRPPAQREEFLAELGKVLDKGELGRFQERVLHHAWEGLHKGDHVIIEGMQRVRADMAVKPQWQDPPKPPHATLAKKPDDKPAAAEAK
jgi:multidrug efflux system membrane fusion protein